MRMPAFALAAPALAAAASLLAIEAEPLLEIRPPDRGSVTREDGVADLPPAAHEASANLVGAFTDLIAEKHRPPGDVTPQPQRGERVAAAVDQIPGRPQLVLGRVEADLPEQIVELESETEDAR